MRKILTFGLLFSVLSACNTSGLSNGQKISNAVGIASIVGAGISAANGDYSTASRILEAGSSSISKIGASQNSSSRNVSIKGTSGGLQSAGVNGAQLSALSVGATPATVALSGRCGLPRNAVNESDRRRWYNEANKKLSFGAFQGDTAATNEIRSIAFAGNKCEATARQVYAFLPSLNGAISAANRLNNGPPPGLRCPSGSGAAPRSACQSTQIVYAIKTTAFMCHQICN